MKKVLILSIALLGNIVLNAQSVGIHIDAVEIDSLIQTVRELSGEDSVIVNNETVLILNRATSTGNNLAADYIKKRLENFDLSVADIEYSSTGRNIVATQTGTKYPDSIYIICAHYDGVTDYCADDNASGVAAVIETARILSTEDPAYTIK